MVRENRVIRSKSNAGNKGSSNSEGAATVAEDLMGLEIGPRFFQKYLPC